jgi:hypothetical protein
MFSLSSHKTSKELNKSGLRSLLDQNEMGVNKILDIKNPDTRRDSQWSRGSLRLARLSG